MKKIFSKLKIKHLSIFSLYLVFSSLNAQTPSTVICKGGTINYREFNTGSSLPSVGWLWTFAGGTPSTSILREPSVQYPNPGLFKTTCVSIFSNGDRDTNEAYVLVIDGTLSNIPMNDTIVCASQINLTLNAGNPATFNRYIWSSPDVTLKPGDTLRTLGINKAGTYKVRVENICAFLEKTITVKQGVIPTVNLGPDLFVCRNIALTLGTSNPAGVTYSWSPTGETTPSITANMAGTYTCVATSNDGCTASDKINLIDSCPPVIYVPNAFTPNDAAPNDVFTPYIEGFKSMNMRIYNRWGEKVFETNVLNDGWNGFYNGEPAQEGVYVVLLELIGNDTFRRVVQKDFHLLR